MSRGWRPIFDALRNGEGSERQTCHKLGAYVENYIHKLELTSQKSGVWCCDRASCHYIEVTTRLLEEYENRRHRRLYRRHQKLDKRVEGKALRDIRKSRSYGSC